MEGDYRGGAVPQRPAIPDILIEATVRAIKAGMKPDEFAKAVENQTENEENAQHVIKVIKKKGKPDRKLRHIPSRKGGGGYDDEFGPEPERTYRNFGERRMGFLVIGDQHRFGGVYGADRFIFTSAPPLDFSFCLISRIDEIVTEGEIPITSRNFREPFKTPDERYQTSSLRLSYNVITELDGLINVLYKILDGGPVGLCW
jgi:hypothetical protein